MRKKTLSEIRRAAGAKGNAIIQARAKKDPLVTMKIRTSTHQALRILADARGATLTETLHDIVRVASTGRTK
jgi:hypothetical protein